MVVVKRELYAFGSIVSVKYGKYSSFLIFVNSLRVTDCPKYEVLNTLNGEGYKSDSWVEIEAYVDAKVAEEAQ